MRPTSVLCRRVHFQCVHKYENADFSEEKNGETFGACYSPMGHGHNYILDAFVEGIIAADTGMIINLRDLDKILQTVIAPLNKHHLNLEVPEFAKTIPTTENIADYIATNLAPMLSPHRVSLKKVRLYESDDLWVECIP